MTIFQKIQSLLTAANTKTGESDTTLTDAVQTLIDGYGQGGGSSVNCKIFAFSSAAAVANQDVTVVSGNADVAAHYADANAMVVVRKMTNNAENGSAIILGTNHDFGGGSTAMYMNCNGTTNAAAVSAIQLTAASGSGVSVRCNANGDIIVHCASRQNNFGGADYIIVLIW